MPSAVEICNLALSHLGDTATVASIDPPEGSAQAEHCARFYPFARDSLIEMHPWGFATRRIVLAELANTWPQWAHAYARPADCVTVISVIPPDSTDDYQSRVVWPYPTSYPSSPGATFAAGVPQPYACELNDNLAQVILTNQEQATLRYVARVTDTTKFSHLFTLALSWHLASMLAGPILKGDAGAAEAKRCSQMMISWLQQAQLADAQQQSISVEQSVNWIAGR
jgi:hypothetical protein